MLSTRTVVLCALVALLCGPVVASVLAGDDGASTATAAAGPSGQDLIRAAQRRLGVPADGIAGPATRAAVRTFQEGRGLPATGRLDDETLVALGVTRQALEVVGTATSSAAVSAVRAGEAAVAPEEDPEPTVTTTAPATTATPATATTPAATTTAPATATAPADAPIDDGEGPAAPVTGGALAGAPPPVVGGQLPSDAGLSPVPPKRPTARPEIPEQAGLSPTPPVDDTPPSAQLQARLERIARCESGGNPRAISPDGRYRGKYQFTRSTWRSVGGRGDPAAASEAEQDRRAAILYRRTGPSSWPVCGRM